ncbi:MAG: Fur family transcriptional regulator [Anaerofustis sp.]
MRKTYRTRQQDQIERILKENAQRHWNAREIAQQLRAHGEEVSRATIYRCLDRLTAEGAVRKYTAEAGELACYQLCTDAACSNHFHLKCRSCGKLIHLECGMMEDVQKHIAEDHRFVLDPCQTVLYGECEMCAHMHRNHSGK